MLKEALKAKLPMIVIKSEDLLYQQEILEYLLKDLSSVFGITIPAFLKDSSKKVLVVEDMKTQAVSVNLKKAYDLCVWQSKIIIFINPTVASTLFFDGGYLPVPKNFICNILIEAGFEERVAKRLIPSFRGLTLKQITEICRFAMVRYGELTIEGLRQVKQEVAPDVSGLSLVPTHTDFYWPNQKITEYLSLNNWFFLENTDNRLTPRGILLDGDPGIGKTQAAKYIAKQWKVPLLMLNMATVMDKYLGVSESNLQFALQHIDTEAPVVLLIDEVEKLFKGSSNNDPSAKLLSQLLWWLQEHTSKVFTVMTTNDLKSLPPELYRPGRIDEVFTLYGLSFSESLIFAEGYLKLFYKGKHPVTLDDLELTGVLTTLYHPTKIVAHAKIVGVIKKALKQYILSQQEAG